MTLYKTDAVVLRTKDFGESHRIVTLLTPGYGLVRALAKGVRRPTSRLAAALLPCAHSRLLLWRGRSLDGISQAEIVQSFRPLREELGRMAPALYACELVSELIPEYPEGAGNDAADDAAPFRLLVAVLYLLAATERIDLALRYLELQILRLIGYTPRLTACARCGGVPVWPAPFSPADGGCLCRNCALRDRGAGGFDGADLCLGRETVTAAVALQRARPLQVSALAVSPEDADILGDCLQAHLCHLLQKKLKALEFWETIRSTTGNG